MAPHDHFLREDHKDSVMIGGESGNAVDHSDAGGYAAVYPIARHNVTQTNGLGQSYNIMPPYYVLAYIMRVQ